MDKNKSIAVIGSDGQLGNDLKRLLVLEKNITLFPITHRDIEITNPKSIKRTLSEINPDIIINTAAYNKVDAAEEFPKESFLVNGIGNKNLAEFCQAHGKILAYISTDYVFGIDEKREKPYLETDSPGPLNSYGISKLAGEYFVRSICKQHFIIRTCGLFGTSSSSGKGYNFVELMLRLAREKGHVQVVKDQIVTPTYTHDLAKQIIKLLDTDAFGLYHATSLGECSWYDFAKEIFSLTNTTVNCESVLTMDFPTPARRPYFSVLENYNLDRLSINIMPDWKIGLQKYLKEKEYI